MFCPVVAAGSSGPPPPRKPNQGPSPPKPAFYVSPDRYCLDCGCVIKGQAKERPRRCPRCRAELPMRGANFDYQWFGEWGRCPMCDSFIHRDHTFCQSCGKVNSSVLDKKRRLERAKAAKEVYAWKAKATKLLEGQKQLQRKLTELKREKERVELMTTGKAGEGFENEPDLDAEDLILMDVETLDAAQSTSKSDDSHSKSDKKTPRDDEEGSSK